MNDATSPEPPDLTDEVTIISPMPIFVGPYSAIFKGSCRGELVAVKILRQVSSDLETMRRKINRELFVWSQLDHPNVVPLHGYTQSSESFGLFGALVSPVMSSTLHLTATYGWKWYPNGDAARFLQLHGSSITWERRKRFWLDCTAGVSYLHGNNPVIIHGDLKPSNVLIDLNNTARICDFGLVQIFLDEGHSGHTTTTVHTGTDRYMAPELVGSDDRPTTASDVYALGCIGLHILFSQEPYANRRHNRTGLIFQDIRSGILPASRPDDLDLEAAAVWAMFELCWRPDPKGRIEAACLLELLKGLDGNAINDDALEIEDNPNLALPSLVSSIAPIPDLSAIDNLSDLCSLSNMPSLGTPYSTSLQFNYPFPISNAPRDPTLPLAPLPLVLSTVSSLGSTHSGHTAPAMVPVTFSTASVHSISPSSSFQTNLHMAANSMASGHRSRHSLTISLIPPPPLSIQTSVGKQIQPPLSARRPKAQTVSSLGSTGSNMSHKSNSFPTAQSQPTSGSVSSLSITSLHLLAGPGEAPIPPSALSTTGRPLHGSTSSITSCYLTASEGSSSPDGKGPSFASVPNPPPQTLGTDSLVDGSKPFFFPPAKSSFSSFRPSLGRRNATSAQNNPAFNRPFFGRSNAVASVVPVPNPVLQSRAYAQHLRHRQQQQLKLQEEQRKRAEKKEKKEKKKQGRSSLSLTRSLSSSSSSSANTRASSINSKLPSPTPTSQLDGFKLSPSQRSVVENAISDSEESIGPEGSKKTKARRRSSVRRALEKAGSLVGFNLNLNASKRGDHH